MVGQEAGTTWLEIIALLQASLGEASQEAVTDRRPLLKAVFLYFKKRSIALLTHGDADAKALTRTSKSRLPALAPMALAAASLCYLLV